jgi:tetratricopeptide (TPR) repeat protein
VSRSHFESQLTKDYELLKELENRLRVEDDIKRQKKLELDIETLKQQIQSREAGLSNVVLSGRRWLGWDWPQRRVLVSGGLGLLLVTSGVGAWRPEWLLLPVRSLLGQSQSPQQKVVRVLVADFDGIEPQKYKVTENILNEIRQQTRQYQDIEIVAWGKAMTERDGPALARKLGAEQMADIVIWGWYSATNQNAQVSVNFELLNKPEFLPELALTVQGQVRTMAISALESFSLQIDTAKELTYLTLVTSGMIRYANEDWNGTVNRLTAAIKSIQKPPKSLNLGAIYFFRANSLYHQKKFDRAFADYTQALILNPKLAEAYYNRGVNYGNKGDYDRAISDFNQVLTLNPKYAQAYYNRGVAYSNKGDYDQAIADYKRALELATSPEVKSALRLRELGAK